MIRKDAIKITSKLVGDAPIISANGFISRDLFEVNDKNSNFYMIGSMGLASSIGLGIALKKTKKKLYIFDGDGIDNIANETNFKTFQVNTKDELEKTLKKIKNMAGPIFLLIKVSKSKRVSKRVSITPTQIKTRFMNSL